MTKALICLHCSDIVSPLHDWRTSRAWRWCQCDHAGVRWRDGDRGLLEVTALHGPDNLRVLGISNLFLQAAVSMNPASVDGTRTFEQWRNLHDLAAQRVGRQYLFHADRRSCWALVVRVGESGDITYVDYPTARHLPDPPPPADPSPPA